ncbi:MAG: redoxin family protein [Planctomycetaceae bacterium]|nr:redoxin family protein [Planctomycetaceae bacterium]
MPSPFLRFSLLAACLFVVGCAEEAANSVSSDESAGQNKADITASMAPPPAPGEDTSVPDVPTPDAGSEATAATELLAPGSAAPEIHIAKWMKGDAVEGYDEGQVYVVEFWATWCPPCIQSMPHLASLQNEYGDKVKFIGVTDESENTVSGFFGKQSPVGKTWDELLSYRIAIDDERQTNAAFLEAANQGGIPCAFIIGRTGNVEWIGHPVEMDEPLQMVVDGTWDSEAARTDFVKSIEMEKDMMAYEAKFASAQQRGDFKGAAAMCDELLAKYPDMIQIAGFKMQFLMQGNMIKELNETAAFVIKSANDDPMMLQAVATMLTIGTDSEERDLDLAMEAAARAVELTEEKEIPPLDALARVYFTKGDAASAVEWQKKAVALEPEMESLTKALKKYEEALAGDGGEEAKEAPKEDAKEESAEK